MYRLKKDQNNKMTESAPIFHSLRRFLPFILYLLSFILIYPQSYQELQRLQSEYKKALERQALQKPADISDAEKTAQSTALPDKLIYSRKDVESLLVNTQKLLVQLKFLEDSVKTMPYIGYEIFTQRDTIPFWQNLPIPKHYSLGPGDEVIISLWGETEAHNTKVINRDGQIYIDNIGILNLGGKTVAEAKQYIISKYSHVYSTLLGKTPKSFIDITLGELKSVNVHFVGFVNIPGVHMIHPFSNVITGLTQAGGVNNKGSLRDIQVLRDGQKIGTVDVYNYIFLGKNVSDVRLMDQDIIYIPPRISTIPLTGRVRNPGYYEVAEKESLDDLIKIAGGKDVKAAKTIFVYKNNSDSENNGYLLKENQTSNFELSDGDSIHVPMKPEIDWFVRIAGQIKNPGKYPYQTDMKMQDLIDATMTTYDTDFMHTIDFSRIIVSRKNPSGQTPLKIVVDLENENFALANGDHITIPRTDQHQPIESVKITGEIKIPGLYPVNNLTTLGTILDLAGGYTNHALKNGVEVFRDSLKIAWEDDTFFLNNGDSLNVLKKSGLVLVKGEVNQPGYVTFEKGSSLKKYINRAGGFSAFADNRDVVVIHPNGTAIPKSRWSSPKVMEGSTIIVYQRALTGSSKGPTGWQAFTMISSQTANVATTLLTLMLLASQTSPN